MRFDILGSHLTTENGSSGQISSGGGIAVGLSDEKIEEGELF